VSIPVIPATGKLNRSGAFPSTDGRSGGAVCTETLVDTTNIHVVYLRQ